MKNILDNYTTAYDEIINTIEKHCRLETSLPYMVRVITDRRWMLDMEGDASTSKRSFSIDKKDNDIYSVEYTINYDDYLTDRGNFDNVKYDNAERYDVKTQPLLSYVTDDYLTYSNIDIVIRVDDDYTIILAEAEGIDGYGDYNGDITIFIVRNDMERYDDYDLGYHEGMIDAEHDGDYQPDMFSHTEYRIMHNIVYEREAV